jgi:hypothetical protein
MDDFLYPSMPVSPVASLEIGDSAETCRTRVTAWSNRHGGRGSRAEKLSGRYSFSWFLRHAVVPSGLFNPLC